MRLSRTLGNVVAGDEFSSGTTGAAREYTRHPSEAVDYGQAPDRCQTVFDCTPGTKSRGEKSCHSYLLLFKLRGGDSIEQRSFMELHCKDEMIAFERSGGDGRVVEVSPEQLRAEFARLQVESR
jgi:hypothetical protein